MCLPTLPTPNFQFSESRSFTVRRRSSCFSQSSQLIPNLVSSHANSIMKEDFLCNLSSPVHFSKSNSDLFLNSDSSISFLTIDSKQTKDSVFPVESNWEKHFEFIRRIGEGSFGVVYCVREFPTCSFFALKFTKNIIGNYSAKNDLLKEANNIRKIGLHLNFVKLYSVWEHDFRIYMQFELCSCSLSELIISKGPILPNEIGWILKDILNGLKYLHDKNFIHLDLKPENLFQSLNSRLIKIGDFGLIYYLFDPIVNAVEGDNRYMAPELLKKIFGKPADIFSLGITILEILTNMNIPSEGHLWHELRQEKLMSLNLKIPTNIKQLIFRMLRTQPEKRISLNELNLHAINYCQNIDESTKILSFRIFYLIFICFSSFLSLFINFFINKKHKTETVCSKIVSKNSHSPLRNNLSKSVGNNFSSFSPSKNLFVPGGMGELPNSPIVMTSTPLSKNSKIKFEVSDEKTNVLNFGDLKNCPVSFRNNSEMPQCLDLYQNSLFDGSSVEQYKIFPRRLIFD